MAIYFSGICSIFHNLHPSFEGSHLEEGKVGHTYVVKIHRRVLPRVVVTLSLLLALQLVLDELN